MVLLEVEIASIKFKNPVLPAAGPPTRDGDSMIAVAKGGAGGLVAKTVSRFPAEVPRPCMVKIGNSSMLNTELWTDIPLEQWIEIEYRKALSTGLPVIASEGYTADDIAEISPKLEKAGVSALELSTHYLGHDPAPMVEAIKAAKDSVSIPVFPKLSPNILDIKKFAKSAVKAGADGIVAINSLGPAFKIDINTGMSVIGGKTGYGWISGEAIKPIAVRCVYEICSVVDVPVIGVGGIKNGLDAVEMIMAGASVVGICTEAILNGPKVFGKIATEIKEFMKEKNYNTIEDFRGLALEKNRDRTPIYISKPPTVDYNICTSCGLCEKHCIYGAIQVVKGKGAVVDTDICYGCGLCVSYCPTGALRIKYWEK